MSPSFHYYFKTQTTFNVMNKLHIFAVFYLIQQIMASINQIMLFQHKIKKIIFRVKYCKMKQDIIG